MPSRFRGLLRPRFSLRTLAIVVTLIACGALWVTWPERTIRRFAQLLREDNFDGLVPLMATEKDREFIAFMKESHERQQEMERRFPELRMGRLDVESKYKRTETT